MVAGGGARARRCRATTRTALGRLDRRGPQARVTGLRVVYQEDPEFDHEVGEDGQLAGDLDLQVRLVFRWRLHVGCWPWDCCQTCDKACNGMEFDGCCCRWAVAHFGQKTAGSPFNCVVLCLLRHGAMRAPAAGGRFSEPPEWMILPSTAGCGLTRGVRGLPGAVLCARRA